MARTWVPQLSGANRTLRLATDAASSLRRLVDHIDLPAGSATHDDRELKHTGKDVSWQGEIYHWSKHYGFYPSSPYQGGLHCLRWPLAASATN